MQKLPITEFNNSNHANLKVLFLGADAPTEKNDKRSLEYPYGYHEEVINILRGIGVNLKCASTAEELILNGHKYDYVFTLLNRMDFDNSEVFISSFCEYLGLKYLGAKPNIRALAEDKHLTKVLAQKLNIPTSKWSLYRAYENEYPKPDFEGPYFIKWRFGASSRDISTENCVSNWDDAIVIIKKLHAQNKDVIVEKLLLGKSITIPVISASKPFALPPVVSYSQKKYGIVTYEQARKKEGGIHRAILENAQISNLIQKYSLELYNAVSPVDYIRVDFRIDDLSGLPQLLEFNICCNISSESSLCLSAKSVGISQKQLISHILNQSLIRQGL